MDAINSLIKRRDSLTPAVAILLLVIIAYYPGLSGPFFSDDRAYIYDNTLIQDGSISAIWKLFTSINQIEYLPVRDLSYLIDYQLFGDNSFGYKVSNLQFYLLLLFSAYFAVSRLFKLFTPPLVTNTSIVLLLIMAIYAMHPAHVESVSWIAGRKDLLSSIFTFLALGFYCQAISEQGEKQSNRIVPLLISMVAFILGMLSKAAIFPVVILMVLIFIADSQLRKRSFELLQYVWFMLLPLSLMCALVLLHINIGNFTGISITETEIPPEIMVNISDRFFPILGTLTQIVLWPSDLRLVYDVYAGGWLFGMRLLLAGLVVFASLYGVWRFLKTGSLVGFSVAAFLILNIPYLQIFPFDTWSLASERFLVLSSFFPVMALVLVLARVSRRGLLLLSVAIVLVFFLLTWQRATQWQDSDQLLISNLESQPSYMESAYLKILLVDLRRSDFSEAMKTADDVSSPLFHDVIKSFVIYHQMINQAPYVGQRAIYRASEAMNYMNHSLIQAEDQIKNYADAIFYYSMVMELKLIYSNFSKYDPNNAQLYYNIALLHLKTGVYWKARESFKKALRLPGLDESLTTKTKKYLSSLGD